MNTPDSVPHRKIKVVVVDDSALVRTLLKEMLDSAPDITVVGAAADPIAAREIIRTTNPDVITLDVEMPRMDGLEFLSRLMRLKPTPVVMVSSLTARGSEVTLKALELGAVDFVAKPRIGIQEGLKEPAARSSRRSGSRLRRACVVIRSSTCRLRSLPMPCFLPPRCRASPRRRN